MRRVSRFMIGIAACLPALAWGWQTLPSAMLKSATDTVGSVADVKLRSARQTLQSVAATCSGVRVFQKTVEPGDVLDIAWESTNQYDYRVDRCAVSGAGCETIVGPIIQGTPNTPTTVVAHWTIRTDTPVPAGSYKVRVIITDATNINNKIECSPRLNEDVFALRWAEVSFVYGDTHVGESVGTVRVLVQAKTTDGKPTSRVLRGFYTTCDSSDGTSDCDGTARAGSDYVKKQESSSLLQEPRAARCTQRRFRFLF